MFRYLERYVGTYAVKKPEGIPTSSTTADDLYIPCRHKNVQIRHTYEQDKLCVFFLDCIGAGRGAYRRLKASYPKMYLEFEDMDGDAILYFMADDMEKVAKEVHPRTTGKDKAPYGKKSLMNNKYVDKKKAIDVPEEDKERMKKIANKYDLEPVKKAQISRNTTKEFLKKYNMEDECKKSGLKPQVFIHQKGKWDDFLKMLEKAYKKSK